LNGDSSVQVETLKCGTGVLKEKCWCTCTTAGEQC